jgi:ornithine cyclodeaminase/alanine dehydrogenase
MNQTKLLSSRDITYLVTMPEAINVIEKAFADLSAGLYTMPVRTITDLGANELSLFYKPCNLPSEGIVSVKLLSQLKKDHPKDIPTIRGLIILTDPVTNSVRAILDGTSLTAIRTGAASGVATRHLARKEAAILAVFGAGTQAYTQFEAVCCEREVTEAFIFDRNRGKAERFAHHFKDKFHGSITDTDDLSLLARADIICTATPSAKPLFAANLLKPGVHINAIGSYNPQMQELPNELFSTSLLYVDHEESCFSESGDLINPLKLGTLNMENYRGEIGSLVASEISGRSSADDITIFKSVGVAAQDLAIAEYVYRKSVELGCGTDFEF